MKTFINIALPFPLCELSLIRDVWVQCWRRKPINEVHQVPQRWGKKDAGDEINKSKLVKHVFPVMLYVSEWHKQKFNEHFSHELQMVWWIVKKSTKPTCCIDFYNFHLCTSHYIDIFFLHRWNLSYGINIKAWGDYFVMPRGRLKRLGGLWMKRRRNSQLSITKYCYRILYKFVSIYWVKESRLIVLKATPNFFIRWHLFRSFDENNIRRDQCYSKFIIKIKMFLQSA